MLLLTGATGKVGGIAAHALHQAGHTARLLVRDADKAKPLADKGFELVVGDVADATVLARAMDGIETAFLVLPNGEQQEALEKGFVDAAKSAGVGHIVKLSSIEAHPGIKARVPAAHAAVEAYIRDSGLRWTMIKANFFMQTLMAAAGSVKAADAITLPCGDGRVSMVDARDVGEVAARILTEDGHAGQDYPITGPETLGFAEIAERMSKAFGRPISYQPMALDAYTEMLAGFLPSRWHAEGIAEIFGSLAAGQPEIEQVTPDVERLLGRPPRGLDAFLAEHKAAFSNA